MTAVMVTPAPDCTAWCAVDHGAESGGWSVDIGAVSKRCSRVLETGARDTDGYAVQIELVRHIFLEDDGITIEVLAPEIRLGAHADLDSANAVTLSLALARAADMVETSEGGD